jgi:valine dehydrogenase (NAD+)
MKLTEIVVEGYEQVIQCQDAHSGLQAIISLHRLGSALGGMRMWPYATLQSFR